MVEYRPGSLEEALDIALGTEVTPVAGGTDLMVRFKSSVHKQARIENPMFIGDLPELKGIRKEDRCLVIGACETYTSLLKEQTLPQAFHDALIQIGSPAIRNQGTIGGNLCNASPAADTLPLLYLFLAEMELHSSEGQRLVPLSEFITGPGRTVRKPDELLVSIRIPLEFLSGGYRYVFEKMGNRKADAISKASFALRVSVDEGILTDVDAAFGAMGPVVALLGIEIKDMVIGKPFPLADLDKADLQEKLYSQLIPIDDQRSTAEYRKNVALNLLHYYLTTETE